MTACQKSAKMKLAILLGLVGLVCCKSVDSGAKGKHWALLVAGSNSWMNYRHQADVCHAFQVLSKNGIPEENIVVMMYDDIADNRDNPTKGVIINHLKGHDVYKGVPKDYTGKDVTPENFLNILQGRQDLMVDASGNTVGSGKVINSGPNDHIFVNFVDHGGPGSVAFPRKLLHAKDWNKVIKKMHTEQKFAQMVIYLEACESGSMFNKLLPDDINVYVTTASDPKHSSYACYYDKKRRTYLGDLYSVNWMENSDKGNVSETLEDQYKVVKRLTNKSHVEQYGDLSISKERLTAFQGMTPNMSPSGGRKITYPTVPINAVPSPDVPLAVLRHRLADATSAEEEREITAELKELLLSREHIAELFESVVREVLADSSGDVDDVMSSKDDLDDHDCYAEVVDYFNDRCLNIAENDHALRYLYTLVNLCERGHVADVIKAGVDHVCAQ